VDGIIEFNKEEIDKIKNQRTTVIFYQNLSNSRNLADIYILPSLHQERSFFKSFDLSHTALYQGLEYFLYNDEISCLIPKKICESKPVKSIGIICGGSDPKNVMLTLYELIDTSQWHNVVFNFYFGEAYLFKQSIPLNFPDNVNFLPYNLGDINENDFLIAAFGVSTYEFMTLGMPIVSLGHQIANTKASQWISEKTNAIFHLGLVDNINTDSINKAIEKMIVDVDYRIGLSKISRQVVDLNGFDRIIKIIENV
jgi:spore coat polysaccharide biosynthesis predicted glycosyltransferase SpsG